MRLFGPAVVLLALVLTLQAGAETFRKASRITVTAVPVAVPAVHLTHLTQIGSYHLQSRAPAFGGISGLLVEAGQIIAITDDAHWIHATVAEDTAPPLSDVRLLPMTDLEGRGFAKPRNDSEGLARAGDALWVSFERDHRVMRHFGNGVMVEGPGHPAWAGLAFNGGLEALITLPGGDLLAFGEEPVAAGYFPVFRFVEQRWVELEGGFAQQSKHLITGADIGPDGRLYMVFRHWSLATGTSIRLRRYGLTAEGLPDPASVEELAAWEEGSGIDNMEGLALWRDRAGGLRLWLVSDDNFSARQRTLLLDFLVVE